LKKKILITNDDGPYSPGLKLLYEAVKLLGEPYVVVPETPKSATGLGLTLHKPLRISKVKIFNITVYLCNGTPSDIVHLAISEVLNGYPDLVVSGVNIGDNTSIQVILSSGTVGAAAQAALLGIPSIAFSVDVSSHEELVENLELRTLIIRVSRVISEYVLSESLPRNVHLLNVNYPNVIKDDINVKIVPAAMRRFEERIVKRYDPQGGSYFWLYGTPSKFEEGTDVYTLKVEKNIAITPITLNLNVTRSTLNKATFKDLLDRVNKVLRV